MIDCVQKLGNPKVSICNHCIVRKEETLDHVMSTGSVVAYVWKQAGVFNVEGENWRTKIPQWFRNARRQPFLAR